MDTGKTKPGSGGKKSLRQFDDEQRQGRNTGPFKGVDKARDVLHGLVEDLKAEGFVPDEQGQQELLRRAHEQIAAEWSDELTEIVKRQGALGVFTRLLVLYPPWLLANLDRELMALKSDPKTVTWQSATAGAGLAGCLGLPPALTPALIEYYAWRRKALSEHWVCKCHSWRN